VRAFKIISKDMAYNSGIIYNELAVTARSAIKGSEEEGSYYEDTKVRF